MELRSLADWTLRPRLLATGGVSQVVIIGGDYKQYQILLDPLKMKSRQVSLSEVMNAATNANRNAAGGFLSQYNNEYLVRGMGRTNDTVQLASGVVKTNQGLPVLLSDVGDLTVGAAPKIGSGSLKGEPAIIMTVMKQPNTNTLELTGHIDSAIQDLKKNLPADVEINTRIFRQADFITASIDNIQRTLLEGAIFDHSFAVFDECADHGGVFGCTSSFPVGFHHYAALAGLFHQYDDTWRHGDCGGGPGR
jgi:Cu/Ag efflux pump CusA